MKCTLYILTITIITMLCSPIWADHHFGVSNCLNYSRTTVTHDYLRCVNGNFTKISRDKRIRLFSCNNFNANHITETFEKCVNRNFTLVATTYKLKLAECIVQNSATGVSYSYEKCLNNNFYAIYH